MISQSVAAIKSELAITNYVNSCDCENGSEVAEVLEMLISKAARAVEKYAGNDKAVEICQRAEVNIQLKPVAYNA